MIKRNVLGKTNLEVSNIGFGGAPIGDLFEKLDEQIARSKLVLRKPTAKNRPQKKKQSKKLYKNWTENDHAYHLYQSNNGVSQIKILLRTHNIMMH